jgi:hypothetical protein
VLCVLGLLRVGSLHHAGKLADLLREGVALGAEGLDLGEERATAGVEVDCLVKGRLGVAAFEGATNDVGLLTEELDAEHGY